MINIFYTHQFNYRYDLGGNLAPIIPITLRNNEENVDVPMIIDTGTSYSIIKGEYAEILNINLLEGKKKTFSLNNGQVIHAYGHKVSLTIAEFSFSILLHFADAKTIRDLLGRDILSFLQLGLREKESSLFLKFEP